MPERVFPGLHNLRILLAALVLACLAPAAMGGLKAMPPRTVISLDGSWQVEQGAMDTPPLAYTHTVVVPGLVDMAQPAFAEVGKKSTLRQAFWYRRTFKVDGPAPEIAILKIHKARYGTAVWLNGRLVGEHLPCFTPALLNVREQLKGDGAENELVVRVGATRENLPQDVPSGWDFEKYLYIPGIYDSVELILTSAPYLVNVQAVPNIDAKSVRIVAEIEAAGKPCEAALKVEVAEVAGGKVVATATAPKIALAAGERKKVDVTIPIPDCRLWSPESPFLYELRLATGADGARERFGMRTFRFDPETRRAMLNGKVYYLRGSNVTAYRFFEDSQRGDKPWRAEWVVRLHQKFKSMHWNSLRYCIGFPPEFWYDIADQEGILIQDEFPIWLLDKAPENPTAEKIIPEYTEWMRERWNHPCVVIWDAQNESVTPETGKALQAVRGLDLSNRPWDNGWSEPQAPGDCVETHPYMFIRAWSGGKPFHLSEIANMSGAPSVRKEQQKPPHAIILNEYGWLWLTRDGNPTCLTDKVYASLLGPTSTVEQRRVLYARYLAAKTEFWRCHRECAGVLHFCGLGYSRSGDKPRPEGGATSDHWTDVEKLTFEPNFERL
ncbi:MAG: hypothetical protein NT049_05355, partial [Planctomycetota bacterium]|nr:hypothetical protein [Planctomycetota bacterium]